MIPIWKRKNKFYIFFDLFLLHYIFLVFFASKCSDRYLRNYTLRSLEMNFLRKKPNFSIHKKHKNPSLVHFFNSINHNYQMHDVFYTCRGLQHVTRSSCTFKFCINFFMNNFVFSCSFFTRTFTYE